MASKTKAPAKTKSSKAKDTKELSVKELETKLRDLKEEGFNLRLQKATGTLENPARIRTVRREAARVQTALSEHRNKAAKA
ncbi:50S ribosomal protein L29 [Haloferula sp. BvORR071]|uniref:50S ribosomal protein L29 n=1 Tax=Haloferula sp. BvORR071 TaxID=1396141 RepID=UPI000696F1A5|nr:50S ribosomal protein L29 [Haloferula sp. BvORR071]